MEQLEPYFAFKGRVRRSTFWANFLVIGLISFLLSLWCVNRYVGWYDMEEHTYITNKPIYYGWLLIARFRVVSVSARRWQDIGRSGILAIANVLIFVLMMEVVDLPDSLEWTLLFLSVIGGLVILGFQGFVPSDEGKNDYGPPPPEGQWI